MLLNRIKQLRGKEILEHVVRLHFNNADNVMIANYMIKKYFKD